MTTPTIKYSLYNPSDIGEINDMYNKAYNKNRNAKDFEWEFLSSPAGSAIYVVAKDEELNKIVGTQCAIPILLSNSKGNKIISAKSEDTLVDNNYRGMNIFENMYNLLFEECKKNGIECIWGFTPALKPFKKTGFETPFYHHQSLMVKDVFSSYRYLSALNQSNSLLDKAKIYGLALYSKAHSLKIPATGAVIDHYTMHAGSSKDVNDLVALQKSFFETDPHIYFIEESKEYLEWRIGKNENHKKIFSVAFYDGKEIAASIIFNIHKNNVWYLIEDLYSSRLLPAQKRAMFSKAVSELSKQEQPSLIRAWEFDTNTFNSTLTDLHKQAGFLPLKRGIHFVWKNLSGNTGLDSRAFFLSRMASQGII